MQIVNYATSIPTNDDFKILVDNIKIEKLKIKANYDGIIVKAVNTHVVWQGDVLLEIANDLQEL